MGKDLAVHFSKDSDEWATPQKFYDSINNIFNFTLDPCSTKENHKCDKYYTIDDDGLNKSWKNEVVFCNPPYSNISKWVEKGYLENKNNNVTSVFLIPARPDTRYWHNFILGNASFIFIKGRLKFNMSKNSAPFPSALVIFKSKNQNILKYDILESLSKNFSDLNSNISEGEVLYYLNSDNRIVLRPRLLLFK